jgi:predicted MFS family arabinose efflux permease
MTGEPGKEAAAESTPALQTPGDRQASFGSQLAVIFAARTVLNIAHRIVYPFLPSIARGLGISLAAASGLVTARLVAGLGAPLVGPLADRYPRRRSMEAALLLSVLACLLLVSLGSFVAAIVAFALFGLAKVLHDPAVHAYLGDNVPYRERGRAVGLVELSWSGAWLLGVPAAGVLIERLGWRAPWAALIGLGLLGAWLTHAGLPPGTRPPAPGSPDPSPQPGRVEPGPSIRSLTGALVRRWRKLLRHRPIAILLSVSALLAAAMEVSFIVYGAWLETAFGLSLSTLGLASIAIGLAETTAELGTTVLTDRLGKKRSVLIGLLGLAAALVALPGLANLGLAAALSGVVLMILAFEFSIVSLLPMVTELAPDARASLFSLNITALSLGRIVGALAGGWLWELAGGIRANALVGAACALAAACLMAWGIAEIEE